MRDVTAEHRPPRPQPSLPRGALMLAVAAVVGTLILVAFTRFTDTGRPMEVGTPSVSRDFRFADRPDGGIGVFVPGAAEPAIIVAPASNGFIRGTLRGLNRERRREDLAAEIPFRISVWPDGRLTLEDLSNGRRVDLLAFGQTNADAFAQLLALPQ